MLDNLVDDTERYTRFQETQAGALICHDYGSQKYYRRYQSEVDLDVIRRFMQRNFCSKFPDVTIRYMAQNWPELCIFAFTDTHIPIGNIIGTQTEPHIGRIAVFAVERRVEADLVYKRLLDLQLSKMREIGIRTVLLKPLDDESKKKLLRYIGNAGPLRYQTTDGEFRFHI